MQMTPRYIGDMVRRERRRIGLRQTDLSGASGVGLRFIVDLEAGKKTAEIGKVLTVLHILGIEVTLTPAPDEPSQ